MAPLVFVVVVRAALSSLALALMPYIQLTDLHGAIPPAFLVQALDDDGDGVADDGLFEVIAEQVSEDIDAVLGQRYPIPFVEPWPATVKSAARTLAAEALYARRVTPEQNPWRSQANALRERLAKIGSGEIPLTASDKPQLPSGVVISEPARTHSHSGRLAV